MTSSANLTRSLVDVAMGRKAADLFIRNGQWVCVQSGEIIPKTDVAIINGHIAFVGSNGKHTIGGNTRILDARGRYLVPGLLDAHMHVESGMVTVTEFVRAVVPHGTTGMFIDPHEMANIFGLKGVRLMVEEAENQPIHVWVQMPSCVPSAPGLETPGASIGPREVAEAMTWPGIIGLGEMMNFPGVINSDEKMLAEMAATHAAHKTIGGHYASPDLGLPFHAYVAGGAEDDHEGTRIEDAIERVRQGMKPMLRYGSAWHDVASQVGAITERGIDPGRFILCTDDSHVQTLVHDGHMDRVLRHAIAQGLEPMTAIQMMTINAAAHFGLTREMGMIAPGRWGDVVLVNDLKNFNAEVVIAQGKVVAEKGRWKQVLPKFKYPDWAVNSVHIKKKLEAKNFDLKIPSSLASNKRGAGLRVRANVIGVIENQAPTRHLRMILSTIDNYIRPDKNKDVAKLALVQRHKGKSGITIGLVSGFGFNVNCAVASTVAHDSHHLIVVGTDESDMAIAVNKLIEVGGGQAVVKNGKVIGLVELHVAGLMSDEKADLVAKKAETVLNGFRSCGCLLNNPNMQLSLLALVVIPKLRLSDKGLVDVAKYEFIPILEKVN